MSVLLNLFNKGYTDKQSSSWETLSPPDGWNWELPFDVQKNGTSYRVDPSWDISSIVPRTGGTYYVRNDGGGNDSNNGLSWDTAWATITKAYSTAPTNSVVYIKEGIYGWSDGGAQNYTQTQKNLSLIGVGTVYNDAYLDYGTYSLITGSVYGVSTAQSPNYVFDYSVFDPDGYRTPYSYDKKTNLGDVVSTPGSFWKDAGGGIFYIHTLDGSHPETDTKIVRPQYSGSTFIKIQTDNTNFYVENIISLQSYISLLNGTVTGSTSLYMKDCTIAYKDNQNLVNIAGANAFFQDCKFLYGASDGIYGDIRNTLPSKWVEINSIGAYFGIGSGTDSWNATTNHGSGNNFHIGCEYYNCKGPNLGHINNNQVWIVDTYSHDSVATAPTSQNNWLLNNTFQYLESCRSAGSSYDFSIQNNVYIRNYSGSKTKTGAGSIVEY